MSTVRDIDLIRKADAIARSLQEYLDGFYVPGQSLLNPAQSFRDSHTADKLEAGHAALTMFVKSLIWQRKRTAVAVKEIKEFDTMLSEGDSPLCKLILGDLGATWHGFNSENSFEVSALIHYFGETLPAMIYWNLSGANKAKLESLAMTNSKPQT